MFVPSNNFNVPELSIPFSVVIKLALDVNTAFSATVTLPCSILPTFPSISVLSNVPADINNSPLPVILFALCASPLTATSNVPSFAISPSFVYVSNLLCVVNFAPSAISILVCVILPSFTTVPVISNSPVPVILFPLAFVPPENTVNPLFTKPCNILLAFAVNVPA